MPRTAYRRKGGDLRPIASAVLGRLIQEMRKEKLHNTATTAKELQAGGASAMRMIEAGIVRPSPAMGVPLARLFKLNLPAVAVIMVYIYSIERQPTYEELVSASEIFIADVPELKFYHHAVRVAVTHVKKSNWKRAKVVLHDPVVLRELRHFLVSSYATNSPGIHLGERELADFRSDPLDATIGLLMRVRHSSAT